MHSHTMDNRINISGSDAKSCLLCKRSRRSDGRLPRRQRSWIALQLDVVAQALADAQRAHDAVKVARRCVAVHDAGTPDGILQ